MTQTPVISLRDIRKSYGNYFELRPVDLRVEPGYAGAGCSRGSSVPLSARL